MLFGKTKKNKDNATGSTSRKKAANDPPSVTGQTSPIIEADRTNTSLPLEEARRRAAAARGLAATFGDAINLLRRAPEYRDHTLNDLEWLLVPAIKSGQCAVAHAQSKANGALAPVGLVLWARVSPEVDRRLSKTRAKPIRLAPDEWTSGGVLWVVAAVGDVRVVKPLLGQLHQKNWGQRPVKILALAKDGKPAVSILETKPADSEGAKVA